MWDNTNPKSIKKNHYLIAEILALYDLPFQQVVVIIVNYILKGSKYFKDLVCSEINGNVFSKIQHMLQDFKKLQL